MPVDSASFVFIISLAAVVNGLGIVRWLSGFAEYVRRRSALNVTHYWVFSLFASFQFILHVLFWWSLWSIRGSATIDFLSYLYLLSGPVLLFLGTAILSPPVDVDDLNLRTHYYDARSDYSTILSLAWLWAIFLSPVVRGTFVPTAVFFALFMLAALVARLTEKPAVNAVVAIFNWMLLVVFIAQHQIQLGGTP